MVFNLSEQKTVANRYLAELRDVERQKDRLRFRANLERIGEILAYEISKTLTYTLTEVETPLGLAPVYLPDQKVVLGCILRAGLPMHQGILRIFDGADNAFISAYRRHHRDGSFEIKLEYVTCPNLEDCVLILADPMLATGASMDIVIRELKNYGNPAQVHIVTAIAATPGLDHIRRLHPEARIWMGALDEELTGRAYIVPGLGDAGDLAFGEKLQE